MSVLGMLVGEDTPSSPFTDLRRHLARHMRDDVDFDTAWSLAVKATGAFSDRDQREDGVYAFARTRFELAYYGMDPSVRHPDNDETEAVA